MLGGTGTGLKRGDRACLFYLHTHTHLPQGFIIINVAPSDTAVRTRET